MIEPHKDLEVSGEWFTAQTQTQCLYPPGCLPAVPGEKSLMTLGQACYFFTLDLVSDYWLVPVREQDQENLLLSPYLDYTNSFACLLD